MNELCGRFAARKERHALSFTMMTLWPSVPSALVEWEPTT